MKRTQPRTFVDVWTMFKDVWAFMDAYRDDDINLTGRRVTNAGNARAPQDYVTQADLSNAGSLLNKSIVGNSSSITALNQRNYVKSDLTTSGVITLAQLTGPGTQGSITYSIKNGWVTSWIVVPPT